MPSRLELLNELNSSGLTPDAVRILKTMADEGFRDNASISWLAAQSIFRSLSDLWDDAQAIPAADFQHVQDSLLSPLRDWLKSDSTFENPYQLAAVCDGLCRAIYP